MVAFGIAVKKALTMYPRAIVENAERIFRLETNHFKSGQFLGTLSPGMEKFGNIYPYGWNTVHTIIWKNSPQYAPIGFETFTENRTGIKKTFLKFPNMTASLITVCAFLQYYNNVPGRWFSTNANQQATYNKSIAGITPKITNEYV